MVAGPAAPLRLPLAGRALIGRGRRCDLRLDHPAVAPAHVLAEATAGGWTACTVDGDALVDGVTLGAPVRLTADAVLSVGPFDLQLLVPEPPAMVTPPTAAVHRAARPPEAPLAPVGDEPEPPSVGPPPSPPGALTLVAPIAVGLVLAVAVHPTAGLVTAAMPLLAVGSYVDGRRRHRRDLRRADTQHLTALAEHRSRVDEHERQAARRERRQFPTVVEALVRARRGVDLWITRAEGAAHLAVGWADDGARAPVTVDLDRGAIGVVGPPSWTAAVTRALEVQAAVRCGPVERRATDVEVAERAEHLSDRCTTLLVATADGAELSDSAGGRHRVRVRPFIATPTDADTVHRLLARWSDPDPTARTLPDHVGLDSLVPAAAEDGRRALACVLGVGADGPLSVDLVADGPHALVAGTTGSGKSELLRTWVTGLARRHPPTAVAFVLVDYKGGSAFDPCATLPHVTGIVTDLDPGLGERLLVAVRAEVREREAALRLAGVGDLRDLTGGPPRLVVVIDEFATLAADLPDFLGALVDVARRGRSLGVHLVLATQRPAGAVNDDIRANTALRIALRTLDAADSLDVLGRPDAATLPADHPGRAWVRRGDEPDLVQVATGRHVGSDDEPPLLLRRVDEPWTTAGGEGATDLDRVVREIAERWGDRPRPRPIWLPPLPERLTADALGPSATDRVVLGRLDRPEARRQPDLVWSPDDQPLVVVGGRRSGRTSALLAAVAALAEHRAPEALHVYAVDGGRGLGPLAQLPHTGAVVPAQDRPLVGRLLGRLAGRTAAEPAALLVIDGLDALTGAVDDADGLRLLASLDEVLRSGVLAVVSATRPSRLPTPLRTSALRITLRLDDPADYGLVGLRPPGRPPPPGRGWSADGEELQLVVPPPLPRHWDPPRAGLGPAAIGPLPAHVSLATLPPGGPVTIGLRDRDLRPARLPHLAGTPFVIGGPPRSGRTTALEVLAAQVPSPQVHADGALTKHLRDWLAAPGPVAFVLDDAERLTDDDGLLRELVNRRHPDAVVLVAVRADAWRHAYGTWLADLRPAATGLALRPDPVHDADLWSTGLPTLGTDPPPGRAVLIGPGAAEVIQVAER